RLAIDYLEDDGSAARALAVTMLALRHPLRCALDVVRRGPDAALLSALAPAVLRLERDRGARVQALAGAGSPAIADARPRRRSICLHAALRPRAVCGAGARRSRRRADHEPVRLRGCGAAGWLRAARAVLPPSSRLSGVEAATGHEAARARARHARLPASRPRCRRRPL